MVLEQPRSLAVGLEEVVAAVEEEATASDQRREGRVAYHR